MEEVFVCYHVKPDYYNTPKFLAVEVFKSEKDAAKFCKEETQKEGYIKHITNTWEELQKEFDTCDAATRSYFLYKKFEIK